MIPFVDVPLPGEQEAIQAIVEATLEKQRKTHKPGDTARRDVHTKSHGTVAGKFRVYDKLPASCKVGLFAEPATYDAQLRFSNGAGGTTGADALPNIRGAAIKLSGVSGKKALVGEEDSTEHDFLLANDRGFFVKDIEDMLLLAQGKMKVLARRRPSVLWNLLGATMKLVKNPLHTAYFSQVPYQFGEAACHWALLPVQQDSFFSLPNFFDRDFLRHAVERTLRKGDSKFIFAVQFQREGESISDSTRVWKGRFIPLAELTISQTAKPVLESDGEALSFNPFRALVAHKPLGWPGRTREAVYVADFNWRTETNRAG